MLAIAETIVWAGSYYLFPALLGHWESNLGWSKIDLAMAMTTALIASAMAAPVAGWVIVKGHGRTMLTGCALAVGIMIGVLSQVETKLEFYGAWVALGVMTAGCIYEPCFAFLTRTRGTAAKQSITLVTLVAGFASTVSFPIANAVAVAYDWRASALVFSVLICVVAVPCFWFGAKTDEDTTEAAAKPVDTGLPELESPVRRAMRSPLFWLLAGAFTCQHLNHFTIVTHLLPMLDERGISLSFAVLTASLIGPMQVTGRLIVMMIERWVSANAVVALSFALMVVGSASLMGSAQWPYLLGVFVVCQGMGIGVSSITRPIVTADLLGRQGFGAISGAIALPVMLAMAFAPSAGSHIWEIGGYQTVLFCTLGVAVAGFLCITSAILLRRPSHFPELEQ